MKFSGIDLHSNNSVVLISDEAECFGRGMTWGAADRLRTLIRPLSVSV